MITKFHNMKYFLTIALLFPLIVTLTSFDIMSKNNLKGKVKSVRTIHPHLVSEYNNDQWDDLIEYDSTGKLISSFTAGGFQKKKIYKYDPLGKLIVVDFFNINGDKSFIWRDTLVYSRHNRTCSVYNSFYQSSKNWTSPLFIDSFDKKGNKVCRDFFERKPSDTSTYYLNMYYYYKYDERNRILADSSDDNGAEPVKHTYKYDRKGNVVEKKIYKTDGSLYTKESFRKFDWHGNPRTDFIFDSRGHLLAKRIHSYIYDPIGNWTTDSIFSNDTLSSIIVRRIEYY